MPIIAGSSHPKLAQKLAQKLSCQFSSPLIKKFSDGNTFVRLEKLDATTPNLIVQTIADAQANDHLIEILFLLDALQREYPQATNHLIMPFFSYAKSDKLDGPGTSLRSQVWSRCLETTNLSSILTLDLHSKQVQKFFSLPLVELNPHQLFLSYLKQKEDLSQVVIVSPDQGYQDKARQYAQSLNSPLTIGQKTRLDDQENIAQIKIEGNFKTKNVIIFDDYTTSGNTILYLAEILKQNGARKIIACITHCLLDSQAGQKIKHSSLDVVITTNSVANINLKKILKHKLITLDCSDLFLPAMQNMLQS